MVIETRYMKHSKTKIAHVPKDFPNKHTTIQFNRSEITDEKASGV